MLLTHFSNISMTPRFFSSYSDVLFLLYRTSCTCTTERGNKATYLDGHMSEIMDISGKMADLEEGALFMTPGSLLSTLINLAILFILWPQFLHV